MGEAKRRGTPAERQAEAKVRGRRGSKAPRSSRGRMVYRGARVEWEGRQFQVMPHGSLNRVCAYEIVSVKRGGKRSATRRVRVQDRTTLVAVYEKYNAELKTREAVADERKRRAAMIVAGLAGVAEGSP